jgi:hypothetical protein
VPGLYLCGFRVGRCGVLTVVAAPLALPLPRVLPPVLLRAGARWRPLLGAGGAGGGGGAVLAGGGGGLDGLSLWWWWWWS